MVIVSAVLTVAEPFDEFATRAVFADADTCSNGTPLSGTFRTVVRSFGEAPMLISTPRADV
jgi:hypothetical protein